MHTCLIKSLHGVVVFVVIIECADKFSKIQKFHIARGATLRYHCRVARRTMVRYRGAFQWAGEHRDYDFTSGEFRSSDVT